MTDIEKILREAATDIGIDISSIELMAAADEIERLREENENLRADLEDTKSLLANKPISFLRPTENHDWWCVSIMERRKRVAAEKENEKLRDVLKNCIAALRHAYFHGFTELYKTTADEAAAALKESGDE